MNGIHTLARGSVLIGLVVLGLKYFAYYLTGSVALLSDAIESIVNVATAVVALLAIRWSAMPADVRPPQGRVLLRGRRGRVDCCRRAFDSACGLFRLSIAKAARRTLAGTRS